MNSQSRLSFILHYKDYNAYALNVILGALETTPFFDKLTVTLSRSLPDTISSIEEALLIKYDTIVVLWSFYSPSFAECAKELSIIKERFNDSRIIHLAGGVHATAEPKQTLQAGFDFVAVGEGEQTITELVNNAFRDNSLASTKGLSYFDQNGDYISSGAGERVDINNFSPFAVKMRRFNPIEITRGCIYACKFCQTPFMFKAKFRHRSVENICHYVKVMKEHNLTDIRFITPTSLSYGSPDESVHIDKIEKLLASIRSTLGNEGRIFFGTFPSEVRPEHVTLEVLSIIKKYVSNNNLIIGGQSGSNKILSSSGRNHTVEDIIKAVRYSLEAGFLPNVDFIFGLPGETRSDIKESLDLVEKLSGMGARIHGHTFMPLPGTPFRNAPPGDIHSKDLRKLAKLAARGKLYGQWEKQVLIASDLAKIRTPPKNKRINWD